MFHLRVWAHRDYAVVACLLALAAGCERHADRTVGESGGSHTTMAQGIIAQLDAAGKPTIPDRRGGVDNPHAALSTAPTPPTDMESVDAPGGGRMLILNGRFRNDAVATQSSAGLSIQCTEAASTPREGVSTSTPPDPPVRAVSKGTFGEGARSPDGQAKR